MSEVSDLCDACADLMTITECLRDTLAVLRNSRRVALPPAAADAICRLTNSLPECRLDDILELCEDAGGILERVARAEA